jgi:hypothetical protein
MNQAEIKVQQYSTTAAARLANLREKTNVSLCKRAIFILRSCVLFLHLHPRPARIKIDLPRISALESLEHQGVS